MPNLFYFCEYLVLTVSPCGEHTKETVLPDTKVDQDVHCISTPSSMPSMEQAAGHEWITQTSFSPSRKQKLKEENHQPKCKSGGLEPSFLTLS